jgi:RNA polymerase sigma-70 factor (ECF subfamily)
MTTGIPQTRQSLLIRIKNPHDQIAWQEFVEIYRPAVYRFARRRGLHLEDAEDITQQVLVSLLRKIDEWNTNKQAGSFRAWLLTVTRNAVSNKLGRKSLDDGCGGTSVLQRLSNVADDDEDSTVLDWELWRATFRSAAAEVRPEFQETTWQAFWRTAVQRKSAEQAADELGVSIGAVYTARCRVLKRLRDLVCEIGLNEQ